MVHVELGLRLAVRVRVRLRVKARVKVRVRPVELGLARVGQSRGTQHDTAEAQHITSPESPTAKTLRSHTQCHLPTTADSEHSLRWVFFLWVFFWWACEVELVYVPYHPTHSIPYRTE